MTYLITSPGANMIGLYYLPLPVVAHETGVAMTEVESALRTLSDLGVAFYDREHELIYVREMARFQIGETISSSNKNLVKGVNRELDRFKDHPFKHDFIARYDEPFGLGRGSEAAIKGLECLCAAPSELSGPLTPPLRDQDQDQDQDQEQAQEHATPAPARSNADAELWSGDDWKRKFGQAWIGKYGQVAYGMQGDARATRELDDLLNEVPDQERRDAQARAAEMFAEFLERTDRRTVERRHPWSFFVHDWGGLRVPSEPGGAGRDVSRGSVPATRQSFRKGPQAI